jgi:hypothetical protein
VLLDIVYGRIVTMPTVDLTKKEIKKLLKLLPYKKLRYSPTGYDFLRHQRGEYTLREKLEIALNE